MKQKIIAKLTTIMILIGLFLAVLESYNLRQFGVTTSINKAIAISEAVRSGLTAHMINNTMDHRDVFLNSISNMNNVEKLWIIRGEKVTKQYGKAKKTELMRDDFDKQVFQKSTMIYKVNEDFSKSFLRITIPYKAEEKSNINCIDCHNVEYGETLGAISMVLDITETRNSSISLAFSILFFTILSILFVMYFANKMLKPHLDTLEDLSKKIKNISNGVFTNILPNKNLSDESKHLVKEYNLLVNGLSTTFTDIDQKLNIFVGNKSYDSNNLLYNSQIIIGNLSEIYQFKKEIELDENKFEIYNRLAQILINKFKLRYFTFTEINNNTNETSIVYSQRDSDFCSKVIKKNPELCRVARNSNDVVSINNHQVCPHFQNNDKLYYCISVDISHHSQLVVNYVLDNEEELDKLKENISLIKNYFTEAAPSLIVKLLMEELKASAFRDGLTGLYNRKFLDEHITKLVPQALREKLDIAVLMLDMDHFKSVNDQYGHDVGDIVLKELANILLSNVRDSDIVVRYGGEEFIILLVGIHSQKDAIDIANKIRVNVAQHSINITNNRQLKKTVSIGVSIFPEDSTDFSAIMKNADIALYDAKENGRNKVVRFMKELI